MADMSDENVERIECRFVEVESVEFYSAKKWRPAIVLSINNIIIDERVKKYPSAKWNGGCLQVLDTNQRRRPDHEPFLASSPVVTNPVFCLKVFADMQCMIAWRTHGVSHSSV